VARGEERLLRRRIRSIEATKKITRAMELIAASQIVRAQARLRAAMPYLEAIEQLVATVAADTFEGSPGEGRRFFGIRAPEDAVAPAVLVVVGDRGLCGGYNANVLRAAERLFASAGWQAPRLVVVGRKAVSWYRFRGRPVERSFVGFSDRPRFEHARQLKEALWQPFADGEVDLVTVVSTRVRSAGTQVVESRQLLPIPVVGDGADGAEGSRGAGYAELEPDSSDLLRALVPAYLEAAVFGALAEAAASEHTARQRAMAAATENAEELVKSLTRVMNRVRQDSITTEIMEIVGGAEALRQAARRAEAVRVTGQRGA
jgi:F-type H+-transporting ATPase subunit gamma